MTILHACIVAILALSLGVTVTLWAACVAGAWADRWMGRIKSHSGEE